MIILFTGCERHSSKGLHQSVNVDTTSMLYVFYPSYKSVDFVCGEQPSRADTSIVFCCSAAFTKERKFSFSHDNIGGAHTTLGIMYKGYECPEANGCFVFYNGLWKFTTDSVSYYMNIASKKHGIGFCQMTILPESSPNETVSADLFSMGILRCYIDRMGKKRIRSRKQYYRALCEKDGKLCIAELKKPGTFQDFAISLKAEGIQKAIYLDTGLGWDYLWYRTSHFSIRTLHPYIHPFVSNWLVFKN